MGNLRSSRRRLQKDKVMLAKSVEKMKKDLLKNILERVEKDEIESNNP